MAGKKFAAEFALRRNVSAQDKILIQDSDDDVVKYAYPPQIASLSGYAYAQSVANLPLLPTNKSIGYIVGQMLYIYVGMGGDTKDGLYQSVGFFVGPQGVQGEKGEKGERGEQGVQGPKGDNGGLSLQEIDVYLAKKQYVTGDTLADMLADYVSNTSLMRDYVTIAKTQDVTGVKNFTAGVQFGGLSMYKSKDDTVYLDGNLVVRGGVTAFGTNETITPSIFEALPIDGATLKRTENGVLYVDTTVVGGGGVADSVAWANITGKPTWIGLEKPSYKYSEIGETPDLSIYATQSWVTGKGYITGITGTMVTNALGYTPLSTTGTAASAYRLNAITVGSLVANTWDSSDGLSVSGWNTDGGWNTKYGTSLNISGFNTWHHRLGFNTNGVIEHWAAINTTTMSKVGDIAYVANIPTKLSQLTDDVVSGKYLPLTGGTVSGQITAPTFVGVASNATYWNASSVRPASANIAVTGMTTLSHFLATGSMTTGKPAVDGTILHSEWDNNSGYSHQVFFANNSKADANSRIQWRAMYAGVWGEWKSVAFTDCTSMTPSSGTLTINGNILATGGVTATNSSDERLKRNLRKFNASKVLMSLGGVYEYEYVDSEVRKNHIYEGTHYGLIYQHVKGTTLDVMCHEREDGFGTLNYIHPKFISLIAGATMENISEIEQVKRENRELRKELEQLKQRVA